MLIESLIIWMKLVLSNHHRLKSIKWSIHLLQYILQIMKFHHFSVHSVHISREISQNFKHILQNIPRRISAVYYVIACNYFYWNLLLLSILFIFKRYKYRRDCVTHMKRKHSNTVTGREISDCSNQSKLWLGSISQYIQKLNDLTRTNNTIQPSSSTPNNLNSSIELKRYGCPYCSLMTKSTSSIYKHQSRKHASFPKLVHKYSTDDPNTRSLVAILKQKSIKSKPCVSDGGSTFFSID